MALALVVVLSLGVTVECKKGMRDDPLLIVKAEKNHYVYFLPDEMKTCENYGYMFVKKAVTRACGCKVLKSPGEKDRLRLRCVHWKSDGTVVSDTLGIYYYYPEMTGACNKMRDHMMFKAKPL